MKLEVSTAEMTLKVVQGHR